MTLLKLFMDYFFFFAKILNKLTFEQKVHKYNKVNIISYLSSKNIIDYLKQYNQIFLIFFL
jgi:hypothetical protein